MTVVPNTVTGLAEYAYAADTGGGMFTGSQLVLLHLQVGQLRKLHRWDAAQPIVPVVSPIVNSCSRLRWLYHPITTLF